jgi:hypothetical protein
MSLDSFVTERAAASRRSTYSGRDWLPTLEQIRNAARLHIAWPTPDDDSSLVEPDSVMLTGMRQAIGLIVVTAIVAGFIPFCINWWTAARVGTVVPLAAAAQRIGESQTPAALPAPILRTAVEAMAGLPPALFPGWLAAGLSALGLWISQPLNWLAIWLVYGLGVLVVLKLLGAPTTLQHFYGVTGYAALPLILTALAPIPYLGALFTLVAYIWALTLYIQVLRVETGLDAWRVILAVLLPAGVALLAGLLAVGSTILTAIGLAF